MNNQYMIDNWIRQRDRIDEMIKNYQAMPQQQNPINNFINTNQNSVQENLYEMKKLNENDEVENIAIFKDTIFIGEDRLQIKKMDGTIEKYEIKKIYPRDKKDDKIDELNKKIEELEMRLNGSREYRTIDEPIKECESTTTNVDGVVESTTKATSTKSTKPTK